MHTFKGLYLVQYAYIQGVIFGTICIYSRGYIWYNMHTFKGLYLVQYAYIQGVIFGTICIYSRGLSAPK